MFKISKPVLPITFPSCYYYTRNKKSHNLYVYHVTPSRRSAFRSNSMSNGWNSLSCLIPRMSVQTELFPVYFLNKGYSCLKRVNLFSALGKAGGIQPPRTDKPYPLDSSSSEPRLGLLPFWRRFRLLESWKPLECLWFDFCNQNCTLTCSLHQACQTRSILVRGGKSFSVPRHF